MTSTFVSSLLCSHLRRCFRKLICLRHIKLKLTEKVTLVVSFSFILKISFVEHTVVIALTVTRGSSAKRIGMSVGVRLVSMVAHALMGLRCITALVPRALVVCENFTRLYPYRITIYLFSFSHL